MKSYKVKSSDIGKTITFTGRDKKKRSCHVFGVNTDKNAFLCIDLNKGFGFYVSPEQVQTIK